MEYVAGPIIALLLGMKFTDWKIKAQEKKVAQLESNIELCTQKLDTVDSIIVPKVMQTLQPMAKAVVRINEEIGLQ